MTLARSVAAVGGLTAVSRVAGFARDILTAAVLGAGPLADAFFVALKLPNLFRRLFAEGAFSAAFVPLFTHMHATAGRAAAARFAEEALAVLLAALLAFTAFALAATPWIMAALAPGFVEDPDTFERAVDLARLTFPYLLLVSLVALLGGVLNALGRVAAFAAAPILFNLTLIAALLLAPRMGWEPGRAMAAAVTVSGVLQLLWLALACRAAGITLRLRLPRWTPGVGRLARLIGPGALGAGVMQVNLLIDVMLASLLPGGAVSHLYYADRLVQLPLGVIGIAIGTALLPRLAAHAAEGREGDAAGDLSRALEYGLLLGLPAAVALAVAGGPIVSVLFERGAFDAAATAATAAALAAYALGMPAFVAIKGFSAVFHARQDTASPVRAAVAATLANVALSLALMPWLGAAGIALATGIAAWLDLALLAWMLRRRGWLALDDRLAARAPRIAAAAALMGAGLYGIATVLAPWLADGGLAVRLAALAGLVGGGTAAYVVLAQALGAARLSEAAALLQRGERPAAS